jgi:hypothetical protein
VRYSFVFAHGVIVANGQPLEADGSLIHLDLPWRPTLASTVGGSFAAGSPISLPVLDLLGTLRQAQAGDFERSGARARLVGTNTGLDDADLSSRAVAAFSKLATERDISWKSLKAQGRWVRARAEQVLAGDSVELTLLELLDLAEVVRCAPSRLALVAPNVAPPGADTQPG